MVVTAIGHRFNRLHGKAERFLHTNPATRDLSEVVAETLLEMKPHGFIYSGLLGFDMVAATVAINAGIPTITAMPYKGYNKAWHREANDMLDHIISRSRHCRYVSRKYHPDRTERHLRFLIGNANTVLTLWDGNPGRIHETVNLSWSLRTEVKNLWPDFAKLTAEKQI